MPRGIIYITTTSVTGLIKIGKTRTDQFESRMRNLETNGYWNVSGLKRHYAVEVDDYDDKEALIHTVFSKSQVANSELFALDVKLAKEMLDAFEGKQIYPPVTEKKDDDAADNVTSKGKERAAPFSFEMLEIPAGSTLHYLHDESITCTVANHKNKVTYQKEEYSLSGLTQKLKNSKSEQGPKYWKYNGKILTDIRKEKEENSNIK